MAWVRCFDISELKNSSDSVSLTTKGGLLLYPNPAETKLNVVWENHQIEEEQIITPIGTVVWKIGLAGADRNSINVESFISGYYLIILKDNEGRTTQGSWIRP